MRKILNCLTVVAVFILLLGLSTVSAETIQLPQWYKMTASFDEAPAVGKAVNVNVELNAIIGDLENVNLRLLLPEGWSVNKPKQEVKKIAAGNTEKITFSVTPKSCLAQGSVIVEGIFDTPKDSIYIAIDKIATDKEMAEGMKANVKAWPEPTKRYTDISFAIFPEESFYPLSGQMWINYADDMAPDEGFRGPVYYKDSMISVHQAQTDVEMYNKLAELMKTDETLATKLTETGIDLNKKRSDYLNGLYVLAVEAWANQDFQTALDLLDQLEKGSEGLKTVSLTNLKIASGNLRALVFWKQGQKRLAEEAFKKTFGENRKHNLQRYVLRNIGLLMCASKDRKTALQMLELAMAMKKGYTLLEHEKALLSNE